MTRVKVKVLSRPLDRTHIPGDPGCEEYTVQTDEELHAAYPCVAKKRKRSPKPDEKQRHRPSQRFDRCDSAHGTSSSSQTSDGGKRVSLKSRPDGHDDWAEITGVSSCQPGSIRLKVKPCKVPDSAVERSLSYGAKDSMLHRCATSKSAERPSDLSSRICSASGARTDPQRLTETNMDELRTAITVLRKIMRMEAAEPFNSPVDPIALGIPDYFEIVKTPMDLGTICENLETGVKYRNSRDVFTDVQLVWENCRRYNRKGDPILELLTRVKKNFMKYWTAAGLCTESTAGLSQEEKPDIARNFLVKHSKNTISPPPKESSDAYSGKHHRASGTGHHKADCLCVVCVGVRRKLAREGKPTGTAEIRAQESMTSMKVEATTSLKIQPAATIAKIAKEEVETEKVEPQTDMPLRVVKEEETPDESMMVEAANGVNLVCITDEHMEDIKHAADHEHDAGVPHNGTEPSEEGTQFYQASYEVPLRKVHPSVLCMSQKLFGSHSLWNIGCHIGNHIPKKRLQNPILKTVSILLRTKSTQC